MEGGGCKGMLLMVDRRTLSTFMFKKKKKEGICFHLKSQLEGPSYKSYQNFALVICLALFRQANSDFSRGHTQAGN